MRLFGVALPVTAGVAVGIGLGGALLAPPDRVQGELVRLMYVHVPAAWLGFLAFAITLGGSLTYLWRRNPGADRIAAASAELGVFFTGLAIVLGSIWGKPTWGVWWTWDPRLVSTALMFFVYLGYLALRRATLNPVTRARRCAVFGVVAFAQVPIVHLSVLWWRTLHQPPTVLQPGDPSIDHPMLVALLGNLAAFTLVFAVLLRERVWLAAAEDTADDARGKVLAGDAVSTPRLERCSV